MGNEVTGEATKQPLRRSGWRTQSPDRMSDSKPGARKQNPRRGCVGSVGQAEEHRVEDDHGRDHGLCPPGSTRTRLGRSPRRRSRRCRGPRQPRSLRVLNPSVGTGALLLVVEEELRQVLLLVSSVARLLMLAQDLRPPSPRRLRQRLRDVHPGPGLNHGRSDRPQFRPRLRARKER